MRVIFFLLWDTKADILNNILVALFYAIIINGILKTLSFEKDAKAA